MDDIKTIIADNITALRKNAGMTQLELAEKLNYSDKAISKWERGESIPDVIVLLDLAKLFGVTLNDLVADPAGKPIPVPAGKRILKNHVAITGMSLLLVWMLAAFSFLIFGITLSWRYAWMVFIYALPVTMIVWLVLNSIWFNRRRNFVIISLLVWTAVLALYLSLQLFIPVNWWILFPIAFLGQIVILLWSLIRKSKK